MATPGSAMVIYDSDEDYADMERQHLPPGWSDCRRPTRVAKFQCGNSVARSIPEAWEKYDSCPENVRASHTYNVSAFDLAVLNYAQHPAMHGTYKRTRLLKSWENGLVGTAQTGNPRGTLSLPMKRGLLLGLHALWQYSQ